MGGVEKCNKPSWIFIGSPTTVGLEILSEPTNLLNPSSQVSPPFQNSQVSPLSLLEGKGYTMWGHSFFCFFITTPVSFLPPTSHLPLSFSGCCPLFFYNVASLSLLGYYPLASLSLSFNSGKKTNVHLTFFFKLLRAVIKLYSGINIQTSILPPDNNTVRLLHGLNINN